MAKFVATFFVAAGVIAALPAPTVLPPRPQANPVAFRVPTKPTPTPTAVATPAPTPTTVLVALPEPTPTTVLVELPTPIADAPGELRAPVPAPPPWLFDLLTQYRHPEWGPDELDAWAVLIFKESSYTPHAQNPTSTAYGLGQFLNATWGTVGCVKTNDAPTQILCMSRYVSARYGTPSAALRFHDANNFY